MTVDDLIKIDPILEYFNYLHLREGVLRDTSQQFAELAYEMAVKLPRSAERIVVFRKLLEAKDAAVRSALPLLK